MLPADRRANPKNKTPQGGNSAGFLYLTLERVRKNHKVKYKRKHRLRVGGKMSKHGADKAGLVLAWGVALSAVISAVALLVWALK
nr:MAG TPA: membrane protein complex protein [Caudoviricetes sp.]